jgi:hypothetical protein
MSSPILPLAHVITNERIRAADNARLARAVRPEPPQPQRPRRIRRLASVAFSAIR